MNEFILLNSALLAFGVGGVKKYLPAVWQKIPKQYRFPVLVLLSTLVTVVQLRSEGKDWPEIATAIIVMATGAGGMRSGARSVLVKGKKT